MASLNYHDELNHAREARHNGLEGRARVCARRAAGTAFAVYFKDPLSQSGKSAMDYLQMAKSDHRLPGEIQHAAERLTHQVNADHHLPDGFDLIGDAETIIKFIDQQKIDRSLP